ncbi:MAG: double-strand break repair helicase AddA [Parvularculaceae bacterium]
MTLYDETLANQRKAADPARSAWVGANAGAGKTRVLIQRAARLLLAGAQPSKILCITFTKAAAAEMAKRLFELLGKWALADDATLAIDLRKLEGEHGPARDAADLAAARRLFARALETPGGLKIQTIHSFCEAVLKRFPIEARVAPGFSVIDDGEAGRLTDAAIEAVAARVAIGDAPLAEAFARLRVRHEPDRFRKMLAEAMRGFREKIRPAIARGGGLEAYLASVAKELGVNSALTEDAARAAGLARFDECDLRCALEALLQSGPQAQDRAVKPLKAYFDASTAEEKWEALRKLFLTDKSEPRKTIGDKKTDDADPWARPYLKDAQLQFIDAFEAVKAAATLADTRAFTLILSEIITVYEAKKSARAGLDYDDLIARARALFDDHGAEWVMYKLDQGLDHILVDEAQDTSPDQWRVIEAPLKEFFAGAGAAERGRTFFAVGDQKQSIYSFQGADAGIFREKEQEIGKMIGAAAAYDSVPLTLSFRSAAPVLSFVDALFAEEAACEGLGESAALVHGVNREGAAGCVELWPLAPKPEKQALKPWDAPVDAPRPDSPARALAKQVANTVKEWIDGGEALESRDRPIHAGDVMILVQSRGSLFYEAIKALARSGVPVAGADRLALLEDAAVEDLLAYARTVLLLTDDLSLAETLKGPLFGFDDKTLFGLAHGRKGTLWRALVSRARDDARCAEVVEEIRKARAVALREGAYAFFTHCLETGAPSGRKRLYARLSQAAREPVDEFLRQALDYESENPRNLQGFLVWFAANAGEIKREMEQVENAVRVMTVHGAKGLEANIVFLLDAHRGPNLTNIGPALELRSTPDAPDRPPGLFALSSSRAEDCAAAAASRAEEKRRHFEEYRRLLYVAVTRARDRLYICGIESGPGKQDPRNKPVLEQSWHALAQSAFERLDGVAPAGALWDRDILRIDCAQTAAPEDKKESKPSPASAETPDWLFQEAPVESAPERLSPSRLADEEEAESEGAAYSPIGAGGRYFRGRVIHRLLELLPELLPAERSAAADRLLARLAPDVDVNERGVWREETLRVLNNDMFAPVFSKASRAEVAVAGAPKGARPDLFVSGQIDRLAFEGKRIFIVDYKTNRPPPVSESDVHPAYMAQMAAYRALLQEIYPAHEIIAALLWTHDARLMRLSEANLDHAFARYLAAG